MEHYRQAQVIIALAAKEESFVIVGRCADSELKGMKDSLNIFIYAPLEERIKRVQKYLGADANENQIRREIARVDTIRRRFHNRYSYTKWGMREGYDILIDSSILGIDGTVDLLEKMVKEHFEIEG